VILLLVTFIPSILPQPPRSRNQVALNKTIGYFAKNYNVTTGLIPHSPGNRSFFLYPDNYVVSLALFRYGGGNQSTQGFSTALNAAFGGYLVTAPGNFRLSSYTALNSTRGSFQCSEIVSEGWTSQGSTTIQGRGSAEIASVANDAGQSCTTGNFADLLLLQAVFYHHMGNDSTALSLLQLARGEFDGHGFSDQASGGSYQTSKLALYVYASTCLNQGSSDQTLPKVETILLHQQDNVTGGFYPTYDSNLDHIGTIVDTGTTALAALAVELMINPATTC